MPTFPYHAVPDGAILAPHHLYIGAVLALLAAATVWDHKPREDPVAVTAGLLAALFGFLVTWPVWPVTGAALTLAGLAFALGAVFLAPFWHGRYPWLSGYRPGARSVVLLGILLALDDAVQHAFGWATPLDWFWKAALAPLLPGSPIPA